MRKKEWQRKSRKERMKERRGLTKEAERKWENVFNRSSVFLSTLCIQVSKERKKDIFLDKWNIQ